MKIFIHTLGCKVNQYESQAIATLLRSRGGEIVDSAEGCDVIIVNTCAVTAEAVRKSRQEISRFKALSPNAVTAVCGCWSQTEPENAEKLGIDVLYGSGDKMSFVEAILAKSKTVNVDNSFERRQFEPLPSGAVEERTRALLKIEDGCVNFCTYCIIPYARGRVRSLPLEACAEEAKKLALAGYREIVLTGIEIASYGKDLEGRPTLTDAICAIAGAAPDCRIRLGSLEPTVVTEDFVRRLHECGNVCDHFHLSLQSGCDKTLKNMNRKYGTARFYEAVELLRRFFPNCGITCDLITGFPGETESDHAETLEFIQKCAFSAMHVFPYSRRKGTPADKMDCQIEKRVKQARAREAIAVAKRMQREFLLSQVGKTLPVLFETEENGLWQGHTTNYLVCRAEGINLHNSVKNVFIDSVEGDSLKGTIL
ncbi:MAG: tRNA (N(6)-L-threonylcarbamoyladenosine(37)-C(2))-methylthiotransferase MtaB [Oscillospiraceae bacterium]|nr:tRNA (N(6)-L-threonylcarbamoyladenosine(37)-C(2))-methylthiotransferase MtaB [Oscillospiraceae bacterium]